MKADECTGGSALHHSHSSLTIHGLNNLEATGKSGQKSQPFYNVVLQYCKGISERMKEEGNNPVIEKTSHSLFDHGL